MIAEGETGNGILEQNTLQELLKLNDTMHNDSFLVADQISPTTLKTYVWFIVINMSLKITEKTTRLPDVVDGLGLN